MGEFEDAERQAVIITSVSSYGHSNRINWQVSSPGGGNTDNRLVGCDPAAPYFQCVKSVVNGADPQASNPDVRDTFASFRGDPNSDIGGLMPRPLPTGENMIISEVFYKYTPILEDVLKGLSIGQSAPYFLQERIYVKRTFFIPRNGALTALPPTFPVTP